MTQWDSHYLHPNADLWFAYCRRPCSTNHAVLISAITKTTSIPVLTTAVSASNKYSHQLNTVAVTMDTFGHIQCPLEYNYVAERRPLKPSKLWRDIVSISSYYYSHNVLIKVMLMQISCRHGKGKTAMGLTLRMVLTIRQTQKHNKFKFHTFTET